MQAIKIESIKPGPSSARRKGNVVRSQPLDQLHYIDIAPHPPREAPKVAERLLGIHIVAGIAHIAVDAVGVRPIRLDRDGGETLLLGKPFRNLGALAVELVRPVRSLAQQHENAHRRSVPSVGHSPRRRPSRGEQRCAPPRGMWRQAYLALVVRLQNPVAAVAKAGCGLHHLSSARSLRTSGRRREMAPA